MHSAGQQAEPRQVGLVLEAEPPPVGAGVAGLVGAAVWAVLGQRLQLFWQNPDIHG